MPSSANMQYMSDPVFNQKVLFALTTLAVEQGLNANAAPEARLKGKQVARDPKQYSASIATILATASDLTPESSDAEFISAVRQAWALYED